MDRKTLEEQIRGINNNLNVENVIRLISEEIKKEQDKIIYLAPSR